MSALLQYTAVMLEAGKYIDLLCSAIRGKLLAKCYTLTNTFALGLVETIRTPAFEVSFCVLTYGGFIAIVSTSIAFVDIFTSFRSLVITFFADTLRQANNFFAVMITGTFF